MRCETLEPHAAPVARYGPGLHGRRFLITAMVLTAFATPGDAGAETVGSSLGAPAQGWSTDSCQAQGLPAECSYVHSAGVTTEGVLTRVVVRSDGAVVAAPVVVRRESGIWRYVSVLRDTPEPEPINGAGLSTGDTVLPVRVRVSPGDRIGLRTRAAPTFLSAVGQTEVFGPSEAGPLDVLADASGEVLVQGVVEPDGDQDGYGDVSQDRCPERRDWHVACQRLAMRSSAERRIALPGSTVAFQTVVTNLGRERSGAGAVTLELDPPVAGAVVRSSAGACTAPPIVRCDFAGVDPGATVVLTTSAPGLREPTTLRTELLLPPNTWAHASEAYNRPRVSVPTIEALRIGLVLGRARIPQVTLLCGTWLPEPCSGSLSVVRAGRHGPRTIAAPRAIRVGAGKRRIVKLRLTRAAMAALRRRSLPAAVVVTRTGLDTDPLVSSQRVTLRAAR